MEPSTKELHQERVKLWDASIANHEKYIDKTTGLFDLKWVEHRKCPVCSQDKCIKIFEKEGGEYVKCLECSMVYCNPVFTAEALIDYYKNKTRLLIQLRYQMIVYRILYSSQLRKLNH